MKNNEWHIAAMQIYESLFREDSQSKNARGELKFDPRGNLIEDQTDRGQQLLEALPTMSGALRPFLEFIDKFRRRQAAPDNTLVRKKYARYADLSYIE